MLEKLIGVFLLRKTISDGTSIVESMLAGMAAIVILSLIAAMLLCVLILGGIYVAYQALLAHGVAALTAAVITGTGVFCLLLLTVLMTLVFVQKIRSMPRLHAAKESPIATKVNRIAEAFLQGFHTTK